MIRVNGVRYPVRLNEPPNLTDPEHTVFGITDFEKCTIDIRSSLSKDKKQQVLFHELTHLLVHREELLDVEGFVSRFSELLYGTMVENGMLKAGWFDGLVDEFEFDEEVESKRVIVDHDPPAAQSNESIRPRDNAEEILTSGRDNVERSRE